jgi:hypothetical protein
VQSTVVGDSSGTNCSLLVGLGAVLTLTSPRLAGVASTHGVLDHMQLDNVHSKGSPSMPVLLSRLELTAEQRTQTVALASRRLKHSSRLAISGDGLLALRPFRRMSRLLLLLPRASSKAAQFEKNNRYALPIPCGLTDEIESL